MDINTGGISDSFANFVWEPAVVKVFQDSIKFHSFFHSWDYCASYEYVYLLWIFFIEKFIDSMIPFVLADQRNKCCD